LPLVNRHIQLREITLGLLLQTLQAFLLLLLAAAAAVLGAVMVSA
jgi:hypothetical protein